ncbi:MAG: response regulator transcription factor [Acidimicrobiales bacterium]
MTETADTDAPITLAIVNDYGVVLAGINAMLAPHADRIRVLELDANMPVSQPVDLVLYDTFARTEPNLGEIRALVANPCAKRVAVFSWSFDPELVELAFSLGAAGYVSKTSSADELVDALERLHAGERFISPHPARRLHNEALEWPGRSAGLTAREAEVLALITQGKSNAAIADLLHLSVNTIKGNIRSAYAKIGASNRVDAVLWGTAHGMQPDQASLTRWE